MTQPTPWRSAPYPDRLIRLAADISTLEIFRLRRRQLEQLRGQLPSEEELAFRKVEAAPTERARLEAQLEAILRSRLDRAHNPPPDETEAASEGGRNPGLILIHGTHLPPWDQSDKWSEPGSPLFNFIRTQLRSDVYAGQDYFLWEGSYNERGRHVAGRSLQDWIAKRHLQGVDAVTHSHGGNVLFKATEFGADFGHVLLLNCPVRPNSTFRDRSVITARSIRTKLDLVVLADRAAQRFPPRSGIVEEYLPWWYWHWSTTDPKIWARHNIRV
jgi:hypothetical protein